MKVINNRFRLNEIVFFYIVCSIACFIVGYMLFDIAEFYHLLDQEVQLDAAQQINAVSSTMLFKNNFLFFLTASIMPVINLLLVFIQFFHLGTFAYSIRELSAASQFQMLYRHTAFEIVGLMLAVSISYRLLFMGAAFTKNRSVPQNYYKNGFKKIAAAYAVMAVVTVIGALLEGNVHVYTG